MKETPAQRLERIKHTQRRVGAEDDGFWGPKSTRACQEHLRIIAGENRNKWPGTSQKELQAFYGSPGDTSHMVRVKVPCSIKVKYIGQELGKPGCEDDFLYVHKKVADSLIRVLVNIAKSHPSILLQYYGVFDNRPMRGGSLPSLHARGAAIDLMASTNGLHTHWPMVANMPIEVMEAFAREGWLCAGAFWARDAMHFQATGGW